MVLWNVPSSFEEELKIKVSFNYYWQKKKKKIPWVSEQKRAYGSSNPTLSICRKWKQFCKGQKNLGKTTKPGWTQPPECYTLFSLLYLLYHTNCST